MRIKIPTLSEDRNADLHPVLSFKDFPDALGRGLKRQELEKLWHYERGMGWEPVAALPQPLSPLVKPAIDLQESKTPTPHEEGQAVQRKWLVWELEGPTPPFEP